MKQLFNKLKQTARLVVMKQVIYILEKRYSKYLYIEEFSEVINEEEILTINRGIFQIKNIQMKENNTVEIYIDEILKD